MQLEHWENLCAQVFDNTILAIGVTDTEGRYETVNRAWCDFTGYSPEEAKHLNVRDLTAKEETGKSAENFRLLIEGEKDSLKLRRKYRRKDGSFFWAELYVTPVKDRDGKICGVLGIFANIDKEVQAEQSRNELTSYLEKLSEDLENARNAMEKKNIELTEAYRHLEKLARFDPLTGLYNRRALEEIMQREIQRSMRTRRGFALALADIDNFKKVNDTYGHDCGDEVLKAVAEVFTGKIRNTDTVGRWGGEEFVFIIPETSQENVELVLERVRKATGERVVQCGETKLQISITIGYSYHSQQIEAEAMINEADKALYEGKHQGKNRVVCHKD